MLRVFAAAVILSSWTVVLAQTTDVGDNDSEPLSSLAEDRFYEFNYAAAATMYLELLATDSTDYNALSRLSESWNLLGLDYKSEEKKDSARSAFEHAVKFAEQTRRHHEDSAMTYVNLAAAYGDLALFKGGKAKVRTGRDVKSYCERALIIEPTNVHALTILGVYHREVSKLSWIERLVAKTVYGGLPKGSIEKSVEFLQRAIEVDSTALFPNYSLAVTYRAMKEDEAALAQLEVVLRLEPGNSEEARYKKNAETWLAEAGRQ